MTADFHYYAGRALQEAIQAISAKPGAPRQAHEQLTRAYSKRVIAQLGYGR